MISLLVSKSNNQIGLSCLLLSCGECNTKVWHIISRDQCQPLRPDRRYYGWNTIVRHVLSVPGIRLTILLLHPFGWTWRLSWYKTEHATYNVLLPVVVLVRERIDTSKWRNILIVFVFSNPSWSWSFLRFEGGLAGYLHRDILFPKEPAATNDTFSRQFWKLVRKCGFSFWGAKSRDLWFLGPEAGPSPPPIGRPGPCIFNPWAEFTFLGGSGIPHNASFKFTRRIRDSKKYPRCSVNIPRTRRPFSMFRCSEGLGSLPKSEDGAQRISESLRKLNSAQVFQSCS
jgi:hypothetical protein